MVPATHFRFSDLPSEIALVVLKYAAEPTFSQKDKYTDQNPYETALSLCRVSHLVRRTIFPEFLYTISLRSRHSVEMFANALHMQKVYAKKKGDLSVDYTSLVQRMWIGLHEDFTVPWIRDPVLKPYMNSLLPVLLAAPELAIHHCYLKLVVQVVENAWTSHADPSVNNGPSPFPMKTQSLTIVGHHTRRPIFKFLRKQSVFLASIRHVTYLIDVKKDEQAFRNITWGNSSPKYPLRVWMADIPWAFMKSLETFSVVYPHMGTPHNVYTFMYDETGLDLRVEQLTVSASLFRQDPKSFPWGIPAPFSVTCRGEKTIQSDGVSFKVTHNRVHFWQISYDWEKAWASGLTD